MTSQPNLDPFFLLRGRLFERWLRHEEKSKSKNFFSYVYQNAKKILNMKNPKVIYTL